MCNLIKNDPFICSLLQVRFVFEVVQGRIVLLIANSYPFLLVNYLILTPNKEVLVVMNRLFPSLPPKAIDIGRSSTSIIPISFPFLS